MESIAETLHEILLKLPTRDVARCRCVCKAWRSFLADPSFHRLHAHAGSGSGGTEALLVSHASLPGKIMETNVLSVSSPKPMCRIVDLAEGYRIANVCNGFILLAPSKKEPSYMTRCDPVFVCNPVTGEKLPVQAPPGLKTHGRHYFAMGFCAPTDQYKLFCLPYEESKTDDNYLGVYTLGAGSWRRHPDLFRHYGVRWAGSVSPPVLVDGKIYVLTKQNHYVKTPNNILVIDVASEAYRTYRLMPGYEDSKAVMYVFDLRGQPCVAVHVPNPGYPAEDSELHLWVMPAPQLVQGGQQQLDKKLPGDWIRRYSFYCDRRPRTYFHDHRAREDEPLGSWVEDDGTLSCIIGAHMYKYDTTNDDNTHMDELEVDAGGRFSSWDDQLRLPSPPDGYYQGRGIYGGYRPTLLSPQDLVVQQHDNSDNVDEQFQRAWLDALRCHKSSNQLWCSLEGYQSTLFED